MARGAKMGFADEAGLVTGIAEALGEAGLGGDRALDPAVGHDAVLVGGFAADHGGARGQADRAIGGGLGEANAAIAEPIQVRRPTMLVTSGGDGVPALLVGADENDVGLFAHGGLDS